MPIDSSLAVDEAEGLRSNVGVPSGVGRPAAVKIAACEEFRPLLTKDFPPCPREPVDEGVDDPVAEVRLVKKLDWGEGDRTRLSREACFTFPKESSLWKNGLLSVSEDGVSDSFRSASGLGLGVREGVGNVVCEALDARVKGRRARDVGRCRTGRGDDDVTIKSGESDEKEDSSKSLSLTKDAASSLRSEMEPSDDDGKSDNFWGVQAIEKSESAFSSSSSSSTSRSV